MVQTTISYVKVLYELGMELSVIQEAERILNDVPQIQGVLGNRQSPWRQRIEPSLEFFQRKFRILSKS